MLYQWEVGRTDVAEVVQSYWFIDRPGETPLPDTFQKFANSLVLGTVGRVAEIDPMIGASAEHWRLSRMAIVDRLILRMAVYEFLTDPETPKKVIINEALELAKTFSSEDAVKFVNGLLDGITRRLEDQRAAGEPPGRSGG
jgi:N utilization substance protein B